MDLRVVIVFFNSRDRICWQSFEFGDVGDTVDDGRIPAPVDK